MNTFLLLIKKKLIDALKASNVEIIDNTSKHKNHKFFQGDKFHLKIIIESEDDKYVSIGFGRFKLKGKEDDDDADVFIKTDAGNYEKSADQKSDDGGAHHRFSGGFWSKSAKSHLYGGVSSHFSYSSARKRLKISR